MSAILACTDGSLYAPSVYQHAAWASGQNGMGVHVLHLIERHDVPAGHDLSGSIGFDANAELLAELAAADQTYAQLARRRGQAILEDAAKQLAGVETHVIQRHGSLVEALADFEKNASLVVLGKRGEHADFSKGHLGSNLERVVRSAKVPVLVAARAFRPIQRCLIAFDGGPSTLKAVRYATSEALLRGLDFHLLAVGKPESDLTIALAEAVSAMKAAGLRVFPELLQGNADEVIASAVHRHKIDLLVMGAYGHSRVRQFILGSTTTELIRACHVPILLFR